MTINFYSKESIVARACEAAFGRPLVVNNLRALLVEAMIESALLQPEWRWSAADWAGWDFEHQDGTRLEVKQSAAKQSWSMSPKRSSSPRFDIAERTGYWEGGVTWVPLRARHAHLYVFAYHPIADDTADHRDPSQWQFYVLPTVDLPALKTVSLRYVSQMGEPARIGDLGRAVDAAKSRLPAPQLQSRDDAVPAGK
ncbi:MAG TPA: hypothetical protein VJ728_16755 [Candidatus Binataceae bacterium]|nr:hypothetical protein [Candidatus Binataceae bacterium]